MANSVSFFKAFLFKPDYGTSFFMRGRVYTYINTVYVTNPPDVLVVCSYVNSQGKIVYKVLPNSEYRDVMVQFLS